MQSNSSKNNYNGPQNTVNNITAQNRTNQTSTGSNKRQNISSLTPRYVSPNTIFPTVHPGIIVSPLNATYTNRAPTLQQCQYTPQYYPHVYYPFYMPQLQAQQQQQQPQNGAGSPLAGLHTIMAVQPGGFVNGPLTAANRATMPFTVPPGNTMLNAPNANSTSVVGLSALQQTSANLPFGLPTGTGNSTMGVNCTTTVTPSIGMTSMQQNQNCFPFSAPNIADSTPRTAQPKLTSFKQQNATQTKAKLRPHALQIIHPTTKKDILQNLKNEVNITTNVAQEFNDSSVINASTHQLKPQPTVSKSVEIMQNIETFYPIKKFKDATQQAEQKSIASAMSHHNTSVEVSVIPYSNLNSSKSELLITTREMPIQITTERAVSSEMEEKDENSKSNMALNDEKPNEIEIVNQENLLLTLATNECDENVKPDSKVNPIALETKPLTDYSDVASEHEVLESSLAINVDKNKNFTTNMDDLNLNFDTNAFEDIETEEEDEVLPQADLENDDNETFFAIEIQNDEASAKIKFFNETFKTLSDCEEIQETLLTPTNRKQYSRRQLMQLRQSKNSCMHPDVKNACIFTSIYLMPSFAARRQTKMSSVASSHAQNNVKQNSGNNRNMTTSNAAPPPNGHNNRMPSKPLIYLNLSLNQDVKLNKADNAWCPRVLLKAQETLNNNPQSKEPEEKDELLRRVRGILNKLTPEKFEPLVEEIIKLKIDTLEKMQAVMNLVFEKAIDEPNFSVSYAKLCHRLINEVKARDERMESSTKSNLAYFRNALLDKTESEFTNNVTKINAKEEKLKPIREKLSKSDDVNEKIELEALLIEEEKKIRRRSGGTVRFIGELFKISILSGKIINSCIEALLKEPSNEDMLECLCKLLTTVGQKFEQTPTCQDDKRKYSLKSVIQRMQNIASKTANTKISSRIRFMLLDVIDLRKKKWQSTRNEAPKTMEQIEKEVNVIAPGSNNSSTTKRDDQKRQQGGLQAQPSNQSTFTPTPQNSVSDANQKNTKLNPHSTEKRSERGGRSNMPDNTFMQRKSLGPNKYMDGAKTTNDFKWQIQTNKTNSFQAVDTSKLVGLTTVDLNNKKMGDASLFQWKKLYTPPPSTSQQTSNSFAPLSLEVNKSTKSEHEQDKMRSNARQKMPFNKVRNENERFTHGTNRRHSQNSAKDTQRKAAAPHGQQPVRIQKSGNNTKFQHEISNSNLTRTPANIAFVHKANTAKSGETEQLSTIKQPIVFIEPTEGDLKLMKSVITELLENVADSKFIDNSTVSCITKLHENLKCALIYYILTDYLHLRNVTSLTRRYLSNIVSYLIERQFIALEHFHMAYTKFAELASELIVDIPQLWLYVFEFTGPLMVKHILTINDLWCQQLRDSDSKDFGQKFLKAFIQYSTQEVGPNFIRQVWKKFHINWTDYMCENMVEDFIKANSFEYVENENCPIPYNNEKESQEKRFKRINDRIQQMLIEGTTSDQLIDFIHGNINVVNQAFISNLASTLTNFAIKNLNNYSLDVNCFKRICIPVLRRYLDSKDDLEMECLCAIQMLVHDLDHPKDLLQTIFFELSDADIIAQETFLSWRDQKKQCKKCSIANL